MTRSRCRLAMGVLAVAAVVGPSSCTTGSGDAPSTSTTGSTTTTVEGPRVEAGSPIGDGLVVPEGSQMVGSLFSPVTYSDDGERIAPPGAWLAHLLVEGDGFAVYDDLAGQIRALQPQAAMPGTADSCIWSLEESGSSTIESPRDLLVREPVPEGITGVRCEGTASDGEGRQYGLSLVAGFDQAAVLEVTATPVPPGPGEPDSYAKRILTEGQAGNPSPFDSLDAAAVPTEVWAEAALDTVARREPPDGGPFGLPTTCTASSQFTVPDGAEVLIDLYGDDLTSLLAVDDAETAMADLLDQTGRDDPSVRSSLSTVHLADAGSVLVLDSQVMAGGGSCTATSSPDGRTIRIDRFPD